MHTELKQLPELTAAERARYARHLILPQLGLEGQQRLKAARVLVVGAGGLGSPLLQYLAAAGVGTIGIVDPDRVSSSNLQRQVLYGEKDLGRLKVEAAKDRLLDLNPLLDIRCYPTALLKDNAMEIIAPYDMVADGTDNFPTRYLVNDACVLAGKINVYASIFRFEGQVSVFNAPLPAGGRGPNYRDIFPAPPPPGQVPSCAEGGVLGVLPGVVGSMQANEVIKLITGVGEALIGRLFLFDAAAFSTRILKFKPQVGTQIKELINYEEFCGVPAVEDIPAVDVASFHSMQKRGDSIFLLDVREPNEYAEDHLQGLLIPLGQLHERVGEIPTEKTIIVHCRSGQRSARAVQQLLGLGYKDVYNLTGGILAVREAEG